MNETMRSLKTASICLSNCNAARTHTVTYISTSCQPGPYVCSYKDELTKKHPSWYDADASSQRWRLSVSQLGVKSRGHQRSKAFLKICSFIPTDFFKYTSTYVMHAALEHTYTDRQATEQDVECNLAYSPIEKLILIYRNHKNSTEKHPALARTVHMHHLQISSFTYNRHIYQKSIIFCQNSNILC